MKYKYHPSNVCTETIEFELVDGIVKNVVMNGGCPGNSLGVAQLVEGVKATEVIERLSGTPCGFRPTSCPDQLALALRDALAHEAN